MRNLDLKTIIIKHKFPNCAVLSDVVVQCCVVQLTRCGGPLLIVEVHLTGGYLGAIFIVVFTCEPK